MIAARRVDSRIVLHDPKPIATTDARGRVTVVVDGRVVIRPARDKRFEADPSVTAFDLLDEIKGKK